MRPSALVRRLPTLAAAASLALCVLTILAWLRTRFAWDIVDFGRDGGRAYTVQSLLGRLHLLVDLTGSRVGGTTMHYAYPSLPNTLWNGGMSDYPVGIAWHFGCVCQRYERYHMSYSLDESGYSTSHLLIVVPYRWLAAMFAAWPATYLARYLRRCRFPIGSCRACGYDLRATPDCCPECGSEARTV